MNAKQAVALAVGTLAALALVLMPRAHTPLRRVSVQTRPDGTIVSTEKSSPSLWQPATFGVVLLVTGACVYSLRRKA